VREAVSAIWAVRSRSDGGDQTGGSEQLRAAPLLSTAVRSPELRQACARGVPGSPGLGREGEGATANSTAGKKPRIRGQRGENGGEKASGGPEELRRGIPAMGGGVRRAKAWASFSRGRGDTWTYSGELDWAKSAGHRASTVDCRGRAPAMPKLAKQRVKLGKLSTGKGVSPRGGAREGLARSPTS
jgi:hypothetical protein